MLSRRAGDEYAVEMNPTGWSSSVASLGAIFAVLVTGCGGTDCVEVCEDAQDCENVGTGDCERGCEEIEELGDETGCSSEIEDYLDCWEGASNVCEPNECVAEAFAMLGCTQEFCQDNPSSKACDDSDSPGSSCDYSYSTGSAPTCNVGTSCEGQDLDLVCDGEECVCRVDGEAFATLPYDAAFCEGGLDPQRSAAAQACGWPN